MQHDELSRWLARLAELAAHARERAGQLQAEIAEVRAVMEGAAPSGERPGTPGAGAAGNGTLDGESVQAEGVSK